MGITFTVHHDEGYYTAKFVGEITDDEMLTAYREFLENGEWVPGHGELSDLSELKGGGITGDGVRQLAAYIASQVSAHDITPTLVVYAPHDLPYGLARMYSVPAEDFETIHVCRELQEAEAIIKSAKRG
jgi:hypothetical protein